MNNSLVVFFASFVIRFFSSLHPWRSDDSDHYLALAESIKAGQFALNGVPTTFRPPLYPILISIFGDWTIMLQCVLGALTCVLIYRIAKSIWPALVYSVLPIAVYYTGGIMTETLFVFFIVLAAYLWLDKKIFLAGIIFGLAALTRPAALPLLGFAFLFSRKRREVATMLGIALLICLPWIVRNSLIEREFTLTQKSAIGTNLLYGTFTHREFGIDIWSESLKRYPYSDNGAMFNEAERRIKESPTRYIEARIEQYPRLFIDTAGYLTSNFPFRLVFVLLQCCLFGLAIVGLLARPETPVWIVPVFLAVFHLPLWVETRYFLPALPFVCILAWYGVRRLGRI